MQYFTHLKSTISSGALSTRWKIQRQRYWFEPVMNERQYQRKVQGIQ